MQKKRLTAVNANMFTEILAQKETTKPRNWQKWKLNGHSSKPAEIQPIGKLREMVVISPVARDSTQIFVNVRNLLFQ